jgi:hypothetical protein
MLRRSFLLAALTAALRADAQREVYDLFGSMASGLSEGNAQQFLGAFDSRMPGYQKLAADVQALVQQADVQSSVDVLQDTGDDQHRTVQLDWLLQLTVKGAEGTLVHREQTIQCKLEKQEKKWRVVAIEPAAFFAPPQVGGH